MLLAKTAYSSNGGNNSIESNPTCHQQKLTMIKHAMFVFQCSIALARLQLMVTIASSHLHCTSAYCMMPPYTAAQPFAIHSWKQ